MYYQGWNGWLTIDNTSDRGLYFVKMPHIQWSAIENYFTIIWLANVAFQLLWIFVCKCGQDNLRFMTKERAHWDQKNTGKYVIWQGWPASSHILISQVWWVEQKVQLVDNLGTQSWSYDNYVVWVIYIWI